MNNRKLLIIFISCLVLFFAGKYFRSNRTASFDPLLVAVDTTSLDRIQFISGGPIKEEFELKRSGDSWEAIQGELKATVEPDALKAILGSLAQLEAKRVVTSETARYPEYEIDEAQASRLVVWEGNKKLSELVIGGFRFDQVARTASTYVRKEDKPEVYIIDGFAGIGLKAKFDQFRDKKLVKVEKSDLTSIEWMNAAGQKQTIVKDEGAWYYAGMEAVDSTAFQSYLTNLTNAQGSAFSDLTSTQGLSLAEKLTLSSTNMTEPTILSVFHQQDSISPFLIHSTANPEALFTSDSLGLYKRLFMELRQFWPDGQ
jgi:hypothetical protein